MFSFSLCSRVSRSAWDNTLHDALHITSMGQYRRDSFPQPLIRKQSRVLDVALTSMSSAVRLGHTTVTILTAHLHLHRLRLSSILSPTLSLVQEHSEDYRTFLTVLLQCPCYHSHSVVLCSQLLRALRLNVTTLDLPTLLAASQQQASTPHHNQLSSVSPAPS